MKQHLNRFFQRTALALGAFLLMALFSTAALAAPADNNAMVRVVHASPVAGTVDVFVDGTALLPNFQFGTVTDYVPLAAGSHKIQVAPAGKGAGAAVITQDVTVQAGMLYTVAAVGNGSSDLGLQAFVDNNTVTNTMAKVRVYHLSPNAGPVNIAAGDKTVITGLTYKTASDYLTVPAGAYTFNVTATTVNATVPVPATLSANMVYSVFAVGLYNGDPALKFVVGTAKGSVVAGMPNTGNDPSIHTSNNETLPWIAGSVAAILLISAAAASRYAYTRRSN
ncbi:DUF4397 domain-containing protein [Tengunoibacter tsumagoiensis]|uniref:Cell wall anchor n=1 Tax=Tengunoibacter tsumagoiensis TaxID=2014871 RepID=A0A401ZVY5_9CHLR|nr:DUF4397 domain-containing protein [Tengunoibacter tsumagoiensis]GCE10966.1 cell wall anchor [Tengunoibacter tsumagoiensis]